MRRTRLIGAIACAVGALALVPAAAPGRRAGRRRPAGCGATRCRRATRSARCRSPARRAIAAGDFGTLLRTTDAGATWTGLPSGTFTGLTEVQAIDGDRGLRRRRLRRAALRRRRRDVQAPRVHAGRVELPRAARRRLVRAAGRPATSSSPTGPCCAPTTTATRSPSATRCPARAPRAAPRRRPTSCSSATRSASPRRSTATVYRTVDGATLVDAREHRRPARSARSRSSTRCTASRSATAACT